MRLFFFPSLVAIVVTVLLLCGHCNGQSPTPTPFDINKVDFSKITQKDIDATKAHLRELEKQGQVINDKQAALIDTQAQTLLNASKHTNELQGEIHDLAIHDRQMTDKVAEQQTVIAKKDLAILWRDGIILILFTIIGVFLFIKYGKYLTFL